MASGQSLSARVPQAHLPPSARQRQLRLKPCRATATETVLTKLAPKQGVAAEIEKTSWTSRKLYAAVGISAPVSVVWGCLTDYEGLASFIPSLVENVCLERKRNGAVLKQVGAQEVALGVSFQAACTLDCTEYLQGVPQHLCSTRGDGKDKLLPHPRTSLPYVACQDIAFEQVEGDFQAFRGIWRMQPFSWDQGRGTDNQHGATLLSYSLYVQPKPWLPVGLIQDRIEKEVTRNLDAVRKHAEHLHRRRQFLTSTLE